MHMVVCLCRFESTHLRRQVETGMTRLVWHRHSCRCLSPSEGRFCTGKSTSTPSRENRARWGPQCLCHTILALTTHCHWERGKGLRPKGSSSTKLALAE